MSLLPSNWVQAPIGNLCDLRNGRAFKPAEWSHDGLPIVRIQNLNNASAPFNRFNGAYDNRHYLKGGELLFAWSGTPGTSFGAHVWRGEEALLNQHIFRVDFDDALLDRRFFRHAINQKLTELIGVAHGGAGLQHVTKGVFEATQVALPPRAEQKRIADKLDTVLTRVDAVSARLARVAPLLKRFRQSVIELAANAELLCLGNVRPATYPLLSLVREPLRNGKSVRDGVGTLVLRLSALRSHGRLDLTEAKAGDWTGLDPSRFSIFDGDFLVSRGNGSKDLVGRGGLVLQCAEHVAFPDTMIRIRPDLDKISPEYLRIVWDSRAVRSQIEGLARTTAGIWKISQGDLEGLNVPAPTMAQQAEIVRRVETLFAFADRLEARLKSAQSAAERLTPALLAKAFRGELVPQDPNDEPASELLRRLQAAAPAGAAGRGRKRSI